MNHGVILNCRRLTTFSIRLREITAMVTVMNNRNRTELPCPLFGKSHKLVNFTANTESL